MGKKQKWVSRIHSREIIVDFGGTSPSRGVDIPPGWWPAKGGGFIQIKDMAFDHIQAALNRIGPGHYKYAELREELGRRELLIARVAMERQRETNRSLEKLADEILAPGYRLYGGARGGGKRIRQLQYPDPVTSSDIANYLDPKVTNWHINWPVLRPEEIEKAIAKVVDQEKEPGKKKVRVLRKEKK